MLNGHSLRSRKAFIPTRKGKPTNWLVLDMQKSNDQVKESQPVAGGLGRGPQPVASSPLWGSQEPENPNPSSGTKCWIYMARSIKSHNLTGLLT